MNSLYCSMESLSISEENDEASIVSLNEDSLPVPSMDERRLQLLASAFKGSVPHEVSRNAMRKPSVLTLTRRSTSSNSNSPNKRVGSQAVNFPYNSNIDNETRNKLRKLLRPTHEEKVVNVDNNAPFASEQVNSIVASEDAKGVGHQEDDEEEQIQAVLDTIEFHPHTDQARSKIDLEVHAEQLWLQEHPQSDTWNQIHDRIMQYKTRDGMEQKNLEIEIADRFINTSLLQGAEHINNLLNGADNKKERLVVHIAFEFLDTVVDSMCEELVNAMAELSQQAWGVLNKSLMKAIGSVSLGLESSSSRFWKMSGREHLLKGLLADSQRGQGLVSRSAYKSPPDWSIRDVVSINLPLLQLGAEQQDSGDKYSRVNTMGNSRYPPGYDSVVLMPHSLSEAIEEEDGESAAGNTQKSAAGTGIARQGTGAAKHGSLFSIPGSTYTPSLNDNAGRGTPTDPVQRLYELELNHWAGISLTAVVNAPLQIPSDLATPTSSIGTAGVVTYVHLIPQPSTHYSSLLLCGLCNGRVAIYTVRWTGQDSVLIGITAPLEKKEQSPVVDIKTTVIGTNTILTRTEKGIIYIYHLNNALNAESSSGLAPNKKKNSSWFPFNLFRKKIESRGVRVCPLLYRIESTAHMFYLPNLLDSLYNKPTEHLTINEDDNNSNNVKKGKVDKNKESSEDNGISPSAMCFHSSLTLLGSCTSILVGTRSGEVIKYNIDYMLSSLESSIVYPTLPFVHKEYIHPLSAPTGFVLTAGVSEKKGNKVFRELFHYHKEKIIFIASVNILSSYIVSIDQTGLLALWQYTEEYLEGKCWFRPYKTVQLSLFCPDLVPVGAPGRIEQDIAEGAARTSSIAEPGEVVGATTPTTTAGKDHNTGTDTSNDNTNETTEVPTQQQQQEQGQPVSDVATGTEETTLPRSTAHARPLSNTPHPSNTTTRSPPLPILSQLKVREAFEDKEKKCIYKWYMPVYCESREAWLQYRSIECEQPIHNQPTGAQNTAPQKGLSNVPSLSDPSIAIDETVNAPLPVPPNASTGDTQSALVEHADTPPQAMEASTSAATPNINAGTSEISALEQDIATLPAEDASIGNTEALPVHKEEEKTVVEIVSPLHVVRADTGSPGERSTSPSSETFSIIPSVVDVPSIDVNSGRDGEIHSKSTVSIVSIEHKSASPEREKGEAEMLELDDDSLKAPRATFPLLTEDNQVVPDLSNTTAAAATVVGTSVKVAMEKAVSLLAAAAGDPVDAIPASITATPTVGNATPINSASLLATAGKIMDIAEFPVTVFTRLSETYKQYSSSTSSTSTDHNITSEPPDLAAQAGAGVSLDIPSSTPSDHALEASITPVPTCSVVYWNAGDLLIEQELSFTIVSVKLSSDGIEVFLLLASRLNVPTAATPSNPQETDASEPTGSTSSLTVYYIIPYLALSEQFHKHYPKLYLKTDVDAVQDYCVGPILFETHTRSAFVLTKQALRVFSMRTGREVLTHTIPFVWDLESFAPTRVSVCSSQRVLTLAAADDARIAVYLLQHSEDGIQNKTSDEEQEEQLLCSLLTRQVWSSIRSPERAMQSSTEPLNHTVRTVLNITLPSVVHHQAVVVDVQDIIEIVLEHVLRGIDAVHERQRRVGYITDLYGGNLGFISPTTWPPPADLPVLHISAPEIEESMAESASSPNSISTTKVTPIRRKHKKKKKHSKSPKKQLLDAAAELSDEAAAPSAIAALAVDNL